MLSFSQPMTMGHDLSFTSRKATLSATNTQKWLFSFSCTLHHILWLVNSNNKKIRVYKTSYANQLHAVYTRYSRLKL